MFRRKSWLTRIVDALIRERRMRDLLRGYRARRLETPSTYGRKYLNAFTLIELLIAVSIVSILTAIAVPLYLQHIARAQASEGYQVAQGVESNVADAFQSLGAVGAAGSPFDLAMTAINNDQPISTYVTNLTAAGAAATFPGALTITFNGTTAAAAIQGKTLILTPVQFSHTSNAYQALGSDPVGQENMPIVWVCTSDTQTFASAADPLAAGAYTAGTIPHSTVPHNCQ